MLLICIIGLQNETNTHTQGKGLTEIMPFLGIKVIGIQAEAHFQYAILM